MDWPIRGYRFIEQSKHNSGSMDKMIHGIFSIKCWLMKEQVHPLSIRTFKGTSDTIGTEKERTSWCDTIGEEKKKKQ